MAGNSQNKLGKEICQFEFKRQMWVTGRGETTGQGTNALCTCLAACSLAHNEQPNKRSDLYSETACFKGTMKRPLKIQSLGKTHTIIKSYKYIPPILVIKVYKNYHKSRNSNERRFYEYLFKTQKMAMISKNYIF